VQGSFEHDNESSGSIKCWEFLEYLHNWRLLKEAQLHAVIWLVYNYIVCRRNYIWATRTDEEYNPE
jgi:hypothetical protein